MSIEIHPTARISPHADIEDSVRGTRIVVGAHSVIDSFVKIKPAGGSGDVVIGSHVVINANCTIYTGNGLTIGDHVSIAANCVFAPANHAFMARGQLIQEQGFLASRGGIHLCDDVWIGASVTLLDGVTVHEGAVIAAMSLVRADVPAYEVWGGNPMRKLAERQ